MKRCRSPAARSASSSSRVFAEVPLLFEAGWHEAGLFDATLGVSRDRAAREAALAALGDLDGTV